MNTRVLKENMQKTPKHITIFVSTFLLGCVSSRKVDVPIKFQPIQPRIETVKQSDPDIMIPFTRDLYNRLREAKQDIRKLQFFVDQTLILSRGTSQDKLFIDQGKLVNQFGMNENKIELPSQTPGIIEAIEPDGLRISFESANNNIKFINNKYSPEFFIFSGSNWENGTAEIEYKGTIYRASCGTCSSVADAKLVVRQKDVMSGDTKSYIIGGRTIH